ncbi:MAG TPA: hypothetical protein VK961_20835 [Chthoniobacter sp.]|nr:hypothetical protein [Chthoniobacter sp.]
MIRKSKNPTSSALMGVAFFQGLIGLAGWTLYSVANPFGILDWFVTFSGLFFFALAVFARFRRLPAAFIAYALYAVYLGYQTLLSGHLLLSGFLLIKLPVLLLLTYALITAFRPAQSTPNEPESV